jgi:Cu+-exporting ATPase
MLDPLRAGHVAIFDHQFHYFCNRGACRQAFLGPDVVDEPGRSTPERVERRASTPPPAAAAAIGDAPPAVLPGEPLPSLPDLGDDRLLVEPIAQTILTEHPARLDAHDNRDIGSLLLVIAIIAGALAVALTLAGDTRLIIGARIMLAAVGVGMLAGRAATTPRDASDAHPLPVLAAPLLSIPVAIWAAFTSAPDVGSEAASLAGVITSASAISIWLAESARQYVQAERAWVANALDIPGRRSPLEPNKAEGEDPDVRPGETIAVEAGHDVPVDVVVRGAEVTVLPWMGAVTPVRRRAGDAVVAGARVVRGRLEGTCTWSGDDRAFARVVLDARRRADALAPVARTSRAIAERWAIAASAVGAILALFTGHAAIDVAMIMVAIHASLATALIGSLASVHVARGILLGLRRGITYKSADAWERAARVGVAMFCARGTLLLGEPELSEIESVSPKVTENDVLAIAAGAERTEHHPIATAILRAARARGVRPDGVRNPNLQPGLGITGVTRAGEELAIGSRVFLLEQHVSIATAEHRIAELEGSGRSVVLLAVGGRLSGILAFQDGLRPGARAAVQHLLDAQIEPVLMSGDARETCEAIGRSLDIDHIRPEVLPADRAQEVKHLSESGVSVAVMGRAGSDDAALGAADVAVALGAAGASPGEFEVALASDDVRDSAFALALARRTRTEARVGLALAAVPAIVGALAVAAGLLHSTYVPIASLLGGVMGVMHGRALDRLRSPALSSDPPSTS